MTSTETVTVLFTDMPRSTERSSALGTAAADELRRMHFALLRGAIAENAGQEVKTLGARRWSCACRPPKGRSPA